MKNSKKLIIAGALSLGIGAGALLATPLGSQAANNVVLASVDWVTSQITPINSKITNLENKLAAQEKEITSLKAQLSQGGTTPPPPTNEEQASTKVYVSKSSATIHSGATKDYKVVSTVSKGTSLKVIDSYTASTGLWYRVELSSTLKGWIFSGDVSTSAITSPSQVVTTASVNLRKGATTKYSSIKLLPAGTTLTYIQSFVNAAGETWYNVQTSDGTKGWMISTHSEVR